MKIKEAIEIINGTTSTVSAKYLNNALRISSKNTEIYGDWFLKMPMNAISWESIRKEWGGLSPNIKARDIARVMDVIQRLLDTPINERFPEKKYVLSAMRCVEGPVPVKQYVDAMNISTNNVEFHFGFANEKANAMEFTQEDLDSLSGFFPKDAIDALKEPAEDIEHDND